MYILLRRLWSVPSFCLFGVGKFKKNIGNNFGSLEKVFVQNAICHQMVNEIL